MSRIYKIFIIIGVFISLLTFLKEKVFADYCACSGNTYYCYYYDACCPIDDVNCCQGSGCYCDFFDGLAPGSCAGAIYCGHYSVWQPCGSSKVCTSSGCIATCTSGCTPPACAPTYSTSNLGYGTKTLSCTDGCGATNSRTCYCYSCTLPNCPAPLSNTATVASPNMILSGFRSCTNGCSVTTTGDCYEVPTTQPIPTLEIQNDPLNKYDFSSITHSGIPGTSAGNLNDPLNLVARYYDVDGVADVEALFVWFRGDTYTGEPGTPLWISTTTTPKAPAADSWGFMMHREGGTWYPYVPSYPSSGTATWVRRNNYDPSLRTFYIAGTDTLPMISVTITGNGITSDSASKTVTMPFRLRFSGNDLTTTAPVSRVKYKILLLGLDKFSFTPSDNYAFSVASYWQANQLRYRTTPTVAQTYARSWIDTTKRWTIDKQSPVITIRAGFPSYSGSTITISWDSSDNMNLYSVVGNIFSTAGADARNVTLTGIGTGMTIRSPYMPLSDERRATEVGKLNGEWAFRVNPDMTANLTNHSISINIGNNNKGTLIIDLTVFDDAGNMASTSSAINLEDWFVTDGGLAYSQNGTSFQTKNISGNIWGGKLPPFTIVGESLLSNIADYSSEMWADSNTVQSPTSLLRSTLSGSYNIRNFKTHGLTSYYSTLMRMYEERKSELPASELKTVIRNEDLTIVNGNLVSMFQSLKTYNVAIINGNLLLDRFSCNGKALVFVGGNLEIKPNLSNQNISRNACMFVVKGNVVISEGINNSTGGNFGYDNINAYIFADGLLTMNQETSKVSPTTIDGIYINGGVHSLGGVRIYRSLRLIERMSYPVLAIDHHPKYGILGGTFFANNFTFQKIELGFKP